MLGKNHAVLGSAVWMTTLAAGLGTETLRPYYENVFPTFEEIGTTGKISAVILSTIVAAGAAVLPDLDEPEATAARSFGVVGKGGSKALRWAAGGHRQRTHTFLFAGLVAFLGWWAATIWEEGSPAIYAAPAITTIGVCSIWGFLLVGRAAEDKGLAKRISTPVAWVMGGAAAAFAAISFLPIPEWAIAEEIASGVSPRWWLPTALGIGCAAHLLGDVVTKSGVPALWPITKLRFKLGLFRVGGSGEQVASGIIVIWTIVATTIVLSSI